jgi:hypothetical protein
LPVDSHFPVDGLQLTVHSFKTVCIHISVDSQLFAGQKKLGTTKKRQDAGPNPKSQALNPNQISNVQNVPSPESEIRIRKHSSTPVPILHPTVMLCLTMRV